MLEAYACFDDAHMDTLVLGWSVLPIKPQVSDCLLFLHFPPFKDSQETSFGRAHRAGISESEHGACCDSRCGIPLEGVDAAVLRAHDNHHLADAEEKGAGDADELVLSGLHRPGEPVQMSCQDLFRWPWEDGAQQLTRIAKPASIPTRYLPEAPDTQASVARPD